MVHVINQNMTKREERRARWQEHVRVWRKSGLSKKAYCDAERLSYQRFVFWSNHSEPQQRPQLRLVEISHPTEPEISLPKANCAEQANYPFKVEFPKGYTIALVERFSPSALVELVNTLESL